MRGKESTPACRPAGPLRRGHLDMRQPRRPCQGQDSSPLVAAFWGDHSSAPHRAHSVVFPRCPSVVGVIPQLKNVLRTSLLSYSGVSPSAPLSCEMRNPQAVSLELRECHSLCLSSAGRVPVSPRSQRKETRSGSWSPPYFQNIFDQRSLLKELQATALRTATPDNMFWGPLPCGLKSNLSGVWERLTSGCPLLPYSPSLHFSFVPLQAQRHYQLAVDDFRASECCKNGNLEKEKRKEKKKQGLRQGYYLKDQKSLKSEVV